MTNPIPGADSDNITAFGDRINWKRGDVLIVERPFYGAEKVLFDRLASEKRKTLELQRVYDERGTQIGRLESALDRARAAAKVGANVAADVRALADKWNREAIAAGFAASDDAYALYEILGDFRAAGAPAETPKPVSEREKELEDVLLSIMTSFEADREMEPDVYTKAVQLIGAAQPLPAPIAGDVEKDALDAERYRWLRHGDNDELVMQRGPVDPDYVYLPRNFKLDEMIDAHINRAAAMLANSSSGEAE